MEIIYTVVVVAVAVDVDIVVEVSSSSSRTEEDVEVTQRRKCRQTDIKTNKNRQPDRMIYKYAHEERDRSTETDILKNTQQRT